MSQEILSKILQLDRLFQLSQNHCKNCFKIIVKTIVKIVINVSNWKIIVQTDFINLPNIFYTAWFCFPLGDPEARENILSRFPPSLPHI